MSLKPTSNHPIPTIHTTIIPPLNNIHGIYCATRRVSSNALRETRIECAYHVFMSAYHLAPEEAARLRVLSEKVFGQMHLLSIAAVMLETKEPVAQSDLTTAVRVKNGSSLNRSLQRLQAGQFIERLDKNAASESPFRRCDNSCFWALVTELRQLALLQDTTHQSALF